MYSYKTENDQDIQLVPGTTVDVKVFFKVPGMEDQSMYETIILHNIRDASGKFIKYSSLALAGILLTLSNF